MERDGASVFVGIADLDPDGTLDIAVDIGYRETSLSEDDGLFRVFEDGWIDHHDRPEFFVVIVTQETHGDEATIDAYLGCGETDTAIIRITDIADHVATDADILS